ncbi:fatty acid desaturase family protein [Pseudactinotalea sp. Z1739]|uniref:fatty acid desaturase family protein n=1 Tax=Pseudactinotalea sp. Z1739 TaxID=3413028 RepID=UPI003C7A70AD
MTTTAPAPQSVRPGDDALIGGASSPAGPAQAGATPSARAGAAPRTPGRGSAVQAAQRDFLELKRKVKAAGLLGRRPGWYIARGVVLLVAFGGAFTLLFTLGRTPWQLAVAVLFGVLFTQAAFLGHDAAHQQVFSSGKRNEWLSILVANLVVGLSNGWWARKHGKHHADPNTIGKDGDIKTGALVFNPEDAPGRSGVLGWVTRRQGWLFFAMITLEGFNLHFRAIQTIVTSKDLRYRALESVLVAVRLIGFPVLLVFALGPWLGLAFLVVELMVFGFYMGASFAPNHKGMPLIGKNDTVNFLHRQVMTSRNIRGGAAMTWAMGGLNLQIEHHLFPRMPSVNLRQVRPMVRELCEARDIPYTETGLLESYRIVVEYLNRVGLGHADPFECPMVMNNRPF